MNYFSSTSSTRSTSVDRMIAGALVAGVTFVLGYTVVRASLAQSQQAAGTAVDSVASSEVDVVVPGEGTLWQEFGTRF